ncbi:hypothetical protein [Streptomyces telluris]|uniref:Uncharacterized protein n=1 Tax=Streptomyces telluris TaxID=2720021 RepID=A0A9X2LG17_9ACTN|nr:hypothetical protein [Streptomyces telluris]MCQ8770381.1 hypothetical protein [Streptomyces telluris]NJP77884.1 hypothetical protein [Streptomyces telluris]
MSSSKTSPVSPPPSPSVFRRRWAAACGIALAGVLTLAGCTGGDEDTSPGKKSSPSVSAPVSATPSPSPSELPSEAPATAPSRSAAPSPVLPKPPRKTATPPAAGHTGEAGPAARTPAPGNAGTTCEIRSNAGNCYKAGQYCRSSDVGSRTHDAQGRSIICGSDSGKPRWHY